MEVFRALTVSTGLILELSCIEAILGDANITDFQTNPHVFVLLMTTQTGGVGLNLTAANRVIIFGLSSYPTPSATIC